jgi:HSP20 family protein
MSKQSDHFLHATLTHLAMPLGGAQHAWTPNTDVFETPEALVVRMELAGVQRQDLEITLTERLLLVRGYRKEPCRQGRCTFRQMEIDYGNFERRIVVPRSVDAKRVRAQFDSGFLQIVLPKSDTSEHQTVTVLIEQLG